MIKLIITTKAIYKTGAQSKRERVVALNKGPTSRNSETTMEKNVEMEIFTSP